MPEQQSEFAIKAMPSGKEVARYPEAMSLEDALRRHRDAVGGEIRSSRLGARLYADGRIYRATRLARGRS